MWLGGMGFCAVVVVRCERLDLGGGATHRGREGAPFNHEKRWEGKQKTKDHTDRSRDAKLVHIGWCGEVCLFIQVAVESDGHLVV